MTKVALGPCTWAAACVGRHTPTYVARVSKTLKKNKNKNENESFLQ